MLAPREAANVVPLPALTWPDELLGQAVLADDPCLAAGPWPAPSQACQYYRARYYDPKIGRFISADPIGFAGGLNFYGYVGNRPLTYLDPSGLTTTLIVSGDGAHIAVHVDNGGDPVLYDPAGAYIDPNGGNTDIHGGEDANLKPYTEWQEKADGPGTVTKYTYPTTPEQEKEISDRIWKKPTAAFPGMCATEVQDVISGVGPFKCVPRPWRVPRRPNSVPPGRCEPEPRPGPPRSPRP